MDKLELTQKNIECEIRSFLSEADWRKLLDKFHKEGEFLGEDNQITYYLEAPIDLRLQENNKYAKIWIKKGKIHDDSREETEVKFNREDFKDLVKIFHNLGFPIKVKWLRKRNEFLWKGIKVKLDYTKGYGYIVEMEEMADKKREEEVIAKLKKEMHSLGINISSREEFDLKLNEYTNNWRTLIDDNDML